MTTEIDGVNGIIKNTTSDGDITIKGNDGGSEISALTFDMSDAGTATFNHDVKLGDNSKVIFGASDDLQIYHDGTNSYIQDEGTGDLKITSNGNAISLQKGTSETMAFFDTDAGVFLYHDNVERFGTSATETVLNEASADVDFRVEGNGDANLLFVDAGNDKIGVGHNNPSQLFSVKKDQNTDTAIRIANGTAGDAARASLFMDVDGGGAQLMALSASFSTSGAYVADNVTFVADTAMSNGMTIGTRSSDAGAHIRFFTQDSERMRILGDGSVAIKSTTTDNSILKVQQDTADRTISRFEHHNGSGNNYGLRIEYKGQAPDNNTSDFLVCGDTGASRLFIYSDGDIQNHDNAYGAISDERIKQDIRDSNSQWNDIKAVKVRNFKKKDDVRQYGDNAWEQIGVVAQELEAVSPKLIRHNNPTSHDIISSSEFGTLWTADDPETQDAVEEVLYTADDPETQDVLYTADDVETQDGFYTEEDELPEGVEVGDVKPAAKSVGDVKEYATALVGDIKIQAKKSTKKIGEVKEIKEQVKSVNYSILYMKAIKALQEAQTRIETLETKVAALEG